MPSRCSIGRRDSPACASAEIADLAGLYIAEKNRLRNAEEQKRLLYVAMTRAREHLVHLLRAEQPALRRQLSFHARQYAQ